MASRTGFDETDPRRVWLKFCGFLDLSLQDFMDIQEQLLLEQIDLVHASPLGRRLLRGTVPRSVQEFRANAPLTTYHDYLPYLGESHDEALNEEVVAWAHTTGAQADFKWVPYTQRGFERLLDSLMSAFILAAAARRGDVQVWPGDTVLYNTPERPYVSGLMTFGMVERFGMRTVLEPEVSERLDFKDRVREAFKEALGKRVDVIIAMTSVLVKMGEGFADHAQGGNRDRRLLRPRALFRLARAYAKSLVLRRPVLPRDLWPVDAIIGWGVDTPFFREQVRRFWGKLPFELYACTEAGILGMQTWAKEGLVFSPYGDFLEFIPMEESQRSREDERYRPRTLLLNEVQPGETYEVVITNFYGMAFLRYRVGHLVRFLTPDEVSEPMALPQFAFLGRSDDRIDLAGFTRIDEKSIWDALNRTELSVEEWAVRKEFEGDIPVLHVYIELRGQPPNGALEQTLHESLRVVDPFYSDLEAYLGIRPLRATSLPKGSFERFYDERRDAGEELGRRKPPRMNATDEDIRDLLRLGG